MNNVMLFLLVVAIVVSAQLIPLSGRRRIMVMLLRVGGIICVGLALRGLGASWRVEQSRHIVYLVDHSASIDTTQAQWIARRVASLESIRPRQVWRSVLAFGEEASVVMPTGHEPLTDPAILERAISAAAIPGQTTNLEAALLASLPVMPSRTRGRVILLSDGRQTSGSVERVLAHLRRFGLEVYPVVVPPTDPALEGVVWETLTAPATVQSGSSVPLQLAFTNGTSRIQPVDVTVSLPAYAQRGEAGRQQVPIAKRHYELRPGWQVVSLSVPALKTGTMSLAVSVAVADAASVQQRLAFVEVEGPPQLLLVLERPTQLPLLATALQHRQINVALATPQEVPAEVGRLLRYEAVVLYHVPKSAFTEAQVEALEQYLRHFGGGLVMVGLGGKLDEETTRPAALDRILPVQFEPKGLRESTRRVCIVLLIDRSASMMGPRIAATKRAAVELVKQLAPEDLVGVLAFDTVPYVIVEVQQAQQVRSSLIEKLVQLKSIGGTNILPALKAARTRLELTGATVKHIILLSDGNTPIDVKAYRQLLSEFAQQQITISTIGIGAVMVNTEFLEWLAKETGGTFYSMRTLDELPLLVARDTEKTLGELPFSEGYLRPVRPASAEWFAQVAHWPILRGYLTTTAKSAARVELAIAQPEEGEDPLLAHWALGMGRVAVFTSDADTRWSPEWIRWPQFESVWAELVRRTMRARATEALFVRLDQQADSPRLIIEGALRDPTAQLVSRDGQQILPLALVQQGRFRWQADVSHIDNGWYTLVMASQGEGALQPKQPDEAMAQPDAFVVRRWLEIGHTTPQPERQHLPPDEPLLRRIAEATHGVFETPDRAFVPPTEWIRTTVPLRGWLLPIAVLLFLLDVALRGRTML